MNKFRIVAIILLCVFANGAFAQIGEFKRSLGVNVNASTSGVGADVYWNFMPKLSARVGYNRMAFNMKFDITQSNLHLNTNIKYVTNAVPVYVDYQFLKFMYATAGFTIFRFQPRGTIVPASDFAFGDITLSPETIGNAQISIRNGASISPYLGVGFGHLTPKSKVSFALEFGAYYMGRPKISIDATGMLTPNTDPQHANLLSDQISKYRLFPIVKFSVGIRLFKFDK